MLIYRHISPSGKCYIGKTSKTLEERLHSHIFNSKKEIDTKFYRAIRKYGIENFTSEIIVDNVPDYMINAFEMYWINFYDSYKNGYNMTKGGDGGDTLSNHPRKEEIYKIISEKNSGENNGFFGRTHSEEQKIKWTGVKRGGDRTGSTHSDETKNKISNANIERFKSEEERKKVSDGVRKFLENNPNHYKDAQQKMKDLGRLGKRAKKFLISMDIGEDFIEIHGFADFCDKYGLSQKVLKKWIDKGRIDIPNNGYATERSKRCHGIEIKTLD